MNVTYNSQVTFGFTAVFVQPFKLPHLTSYFAAVMMTAATRGRHLSRNVDTSCNKLLSCHCFSDEDGKLKLNKSTD